MIAVDVCDSHVEDAGLAVDETWERERPRIETIVWEPALAGPYGRSLAAQLAPMQISLNKLLLGRD